jgi:hypothetical protein
VAGVGGGAASSAKRCLCGWTCDWGCWRTTRCAGQQQRAQRRNKHATCSLLLLSTPLPLAWAVHASESLAKTWTQLKPPHEAVCASARPLEHKPAHRAQGAISASGRTNRSRRRTPSAHRLTHHAHQTLLDGYRADGSVCWAAVCRQWRVLGGTTGTLCVVVP